MIRLSQLKIQPGQENKLMQAVAKALSVREEDIIQLNIIKKSLDARKKPELFWIYTVDAELKASVNFKRIFKNKNVSSAPELKKYQIRLKKHKNKTAIQPARKRQVRSFIPI